LKARASNLPFGQQIRPARAANLHWVQWQAHLIFHGALHATFAAFGIDAIYTPAGGEAVGVRVIARRPDTIVGFGETRIHAETATFEVRPSVKRLATLTPDWSAPLAPDRFRLLF
jgi:hypothetical protein